MNKDRLQQIYKLHGVDRLIEIILKNNEIREIKKDIDFEL